MTFILYLIGYIIIVFGVFFGIVINGNLTTSGFSIIVNSIIGGVFFLAFGKIVEVLEKIEKKLPERAFSEEFPANEFKVKSNDFAVYDSDNETYQFFILDGNEFLQARVFKNFLEIKESSFLIKLPYREEIEMTVYKEYGHKVAMFSKDSIIFVKLSALNITSARQGNTIYLSYARDKPEAKI